MQLDSNVEYRDIVGVLGHLGKDDPHRLAAGVMVLKRMGLLLKAFEANCSAMGVSSGRWLVLLLLHNQPGGREFTPAQLADALGVTRATMTGLIDKLEQAGLARRAPHPLDRRSVLVQLTDCGHDVVRRLMPAHFRFVESVTEPLSRDNLDDMVSGLDAMCEEAGRMHPVAHMLLRSSMSSPESQG